jgi:hypothetical protein
MKEHFAQYGAVASTKVIQTNQSGRLVSSHEFKANTRRFNRVR